MDREVYAAAEGLRQGAYVLDADADDSPQIILIASGSEVSLIVEAAGRLRRDGISVRCVSMPSWDLFKAQPRDYRDWVLPPAATARLAVEAGSAQGWHRWVGDGGDVLSVDDFGASAPMQALADAYGFTVDNVVKRAKALLAGGALE